MCLTVLARKLNTEMDGSKWRKLIKDVRNYTLEMGFSVGCCFEVNSDPMGLRLQLGYGKEWE